METTKRIPKHRHKPGYRKKGKIKIKDKETGEERWVGGKKGLVRDHDGNPTSKVDRQQSPSERPHKPVHSGKRKKPEHRAKDTE